MGSHDRVEDDRRCDVVVDRFVIARITRAQSADLVTYERKCGAFRHEVVLSREGNARSFHWKIPLHALDAVIEALQRARKMTVEDYGEADENGNRPRLEAQVVAGLRRCPVHTRRR